MITDHLAVSAHDVAKYLITSESFQSPDGVSTMKLHKLAYFCQAYSMAFRDAPIFPENILAGTSGPVIDEFFKHHKGVFLITSWPEGNGQNLSSADKIIVDHILTTYKSYSGRDMSKISMAHVPWQWARQEAGETFPVMDLNVMRNFYRALSDAPPTARAYAERFMDRYENTDHL